MDRRFFVGGLSAALGALWLGGQTAFGQKAKPKGKQPRMTSPVASGLIASPGGAFTTTITSSGSNRLLVVWVGLAASLGAPISATYNGSAIADRGYWRRTSNPAPVTAYEMHVFWTTAPVGSASFDFNVAPYGVVGWAAWDNVDQTSPVHWPFGESISSANPGVNILTWPRTSLISSSDFVYGMMIGSEPVSGGTITTTPHTGTTEPDAPVNSSFLHGVHGYAAGDDTDAVVWGWDESSTAGFRGVHAALAIRAVGSTLPILGTSTPLAWGDDQYLPTGDAFRHWADPIPATVALTKASMQGFNGIGVGANGYPYVWGDPTYGTRGDGTTGGAYMSTAVQVAGLSGCTDVACGDSTVFAIVSGALYGWGRNGSGELGDGSTTQRTSPVLLTVTGATAPLVQVVCGSGWTLVRDSLGKVFHVGWAAQGQRGDGLGTTDFYTTWAQVGSLSGTTDISAGTSHGLAVNGDATVSSWGADGAGQCGRGSTASIRAVGAMTVVTGASKVAGYTTSSAVLAGTDIYTTGFNGVGQLGTGTLTSTSTPASISPPVSPTALATHSANGRALLWIGTDGKLYATGINTARIIDPAVEQILTTVSALGSGNLLTSTAVLADRMGTGWLWAATADDGEGFMAAGLRRSRAWAMVVGL
jgi:hypothetical protein